MRFRRFKSNVETIRTTNGAKDGQNLMFQLGINEFADLTFESRLREKLRQMLKTWRQNARLFTRRRQAGGRVAKRNLHASFNLS